MRRAPRLAVTALEPRTTPATAFTFADGNLVVTGSAANDRIDVLKDNSLQQIILRSQGVVVARFDAAAVRQITVVGGDGNDRLFVDPSLAAIATLDGGNGNDVLSGAANANGGTGRDKIKGGPSPGTLDGGADANRIQANSAGSTLVTGGGKLVNVHPTNSINATNAAIKSAGQMAADVAATTVLSEADVQALLQRASAASASEDAIIAVVDRNGRILGVRVENGVAAEVVNSPDLLTFAIDGALAKARTAAFFANNQAPLTSRVVQFISQTTMTEREIDAYPFITDPNSLLRGPGFVAPVGIKGHFPPNVPFTPQVDLFAIEHTNRDSLTHPGADRVKGTADDIALSSRFDIDPNFVPAGQGLFAPESYGYAFGNRTAQSRGIATLPGGIPVYKNGVLVGGIGVFFPGTTGFATAENSALSTTYDASKPDRSFEAEWVAFAAVGGAPALGFGVGALAGVGLPAGMTGLPLTPENRRIDLVGITLDLIGPGGNQGIELLARFGQTLGVGNPLSGTDVEVAPGKTYDSGLTVPEGWLAVPHDGINFNAAQVRQIIEQGIAQANATRAAIRLPLDSRSRMVFAVTDVTGEVLGLYRMPDATVFSIDVAVAKARNVSYYADAIALAAVDQVAGVAPGTAFTNRTFRYLSLPRFPEGIEGRPPGPFSILNDGGVDPQTGRQIGDRLPASAFQSVQGFDAFNPGTNFRDAGDARHQNGIVFFPGSAPLYVNGVLIGGLGVSGDGVDQDDVVTVGGQAGYTQLNVPRADQVFVNGVRLPYQKFNRNPEG